MKHLFLAVLFSGIAFLSIAQPKPNYSVTSKKAIKQYEEALALYDIRDKSGALSKLDEVVKTEPNFIEAYYMMAQVYDDLGQSEKTIEPLKKALSIDEKFYTDGWLMLAESQFALAKYSDAEQSVSKYMRFPKATMQLEKRAQVILSSCVYAKNAMASPVPFEPKNLGSTINTEMDEYYPCITADEQTLLFTRLVKDDRAFRGMQEDFYISSRMTGTSWSDAQPVVEINTVQNEGAPSLSADGQTLIFTACETADGSWGATRQGIGSCDLFFSIKEGKAWSDAKNLGQGINSGSWESQPSYSADGRTLYFIRGKRSAQGIKDQDIYYSYIMDNGKWAPAQKIPGRVNTIFEEESVMIHPDGRTLYFSSNGHPGMGGLDIFMSTILPNGEWDTPVNLGYPINTSADENSLQVAASGKLALFASERASGFGGLDLYSFELHEKAQPTLVTYVKGVVSDKLSFKKLGAKLELIDLETGKLIAETYSGNAYGDFLLCIPSGRDYALSVSKEGYLFHSENFSLKNYNSTQPYELNIQLQKLKVGANIVLNNVFFGSNSFALLPASKVELNKLVSLLQANPTQKIEIGGHTDNVGADADNQKLSENRAKSVVEYLVQQGIAGERLSAKGYGETVPITTNDTEEGRAKNRRTEFKVVE
jgi:outer membrane protein OmpA-like peptidoglycan-associated protein